MAKVIFPKTREAVREAIAEAPRQAINIAVIAVILAVAAFMIALGTLGVVRHGVQT